MPTSDQWNDYIAKHADHPVTVKLLGGVFDVLLGTLKNLQGRIAELETRPPSPEYKGTFTQGSAFGRGALVSRQGGCGSRCRTRSPRLAMIRRRGG